MNFWKADFEKGFVFFVGFKFGFFRNGTAFGTRDKDRIEWMGCGLGGLGIGGGFGS